MFARVALPLLLTAFATTACSTTNSGSLKQLPTFTSTTLDTSTQATPVTPAAPQQAQPARKRPEPSVLVFLKIGGRSLDDDKFWDEVDHPFTIGAEFAFRKPESTFGPEFGLSFAVDGEDRAALDTVATFFEAYGGLRATGDFGPGKRIHPYAGAGLVGILADERHVAGASKIDDNDVTLGGYAHIGVYYSISRLIHIGVDGRIVFGTDLDLFSTSTDADYEQLTFIIGAGF